MEMQEFQIVVVAAAAAEKLSQANKFLQDLPQRLLLCFLPVFHLEMKKNLV